MINQYLVFIAFMALAYVLGSIPFAYIVTRLTSGKNILEMGWRKSSGSNVAKNVGLWQGLLTAALDIGKGFLAVFLAKEYGLPVSVQILCGVMSVVGHNWSLFLKFKGGRGLGALMGAMLVFSPTTLLVILIPTIIFAIIWTASVGTILSLITGIFITFKGGLTFEPIGYLILLSLIPIFVKRLSPINEVLESNNRNELMENRLIFDQDTVPPFRIKPLKKLFKKD
ncbi:MAG: glycerol-3-phosphate acyltransferase [Candidatus Paceibacterota bacterium]|jgi:glycerol-3-phosphate acyltransferase PlsY